MSAKPYVVDNERYHAEFFRKLRWAEKGKFPANLVGEIDHLDKRAAMFYRDHLRMPANRRPRFPRVVTDKSLFRYRNECYRRGLLASKSTKTRRAA